MREPGPAGKHTLQMISSRARPGESKDLLKEKQRSPGSLAAQEAGWAAVAPRASLRGLLPPASGLGPWSPGWWGGGWGAGGGAGCSLPGTTSVARDTRKERGNVGVEGRGGHTGFAQGHGVRGSLLSLNWGEDTSEDAVSDPKSRPHLEVPEGQTGTSGRTKGVPGKACWKQMRHSQRPGQGPERGRAGQCSLQTLQAGRQ